MSEKQTSVDSWDGLLTNYLKAENLNSQEETFACIGVEVKEKDMHLELSRSENEDPFIFTLNTTNKVFLKKNGINAPKEAIGKKITLKKVCVTNPSTKQEVDSLRICKVESVN